jgi:hypothetical protein
MIDPTKLTDDELTAAIQEQQRIQMNAPSARSAIWEKASEALQPLFAEAATRAKSGRIIESL